MAKKKKKSTRMQVLRRVSQSFFLLALNPYFFMYRGLCFPVMNCWACPAAAYGCPVGAIGEFLVVGAVPLIAIGLLILAGAFIGRMICGWVCPFGFLQDLMAKIPWPKKKLRFPPALAYAKYAFLLVTVIWIPLAVGIRRSDWTSPSDYFFCNICPAGTLEAAIPVRISAIIWPDAAPEVASADGATALAATPTDPVADLVSFLLTNPRMWILYAFLALFVLYRRPFCRGMCPIGAVFALLNRFSMLRLRVDKEDCKECGICEKKCPVDNRLFAAPAAQDCIRCLECVDNCHKHAVEVGTASARPREGYWE